MKRKEVNEQINEDYEEGEKEEKKTTTQMRKNEEKRN